MIHLAIRAVVLVGALLGATAAVASDLGGVAFHDYNGNGTRDGGRAAFTNDPGVGGTVVVVLDASGAIVGQTTTGADGRWRVTGLPAGRYVVRFTTIPAPFAEGPLGRDSRTSTQLVDATDAAPDDALSIGLIRPDRYCQENPDIAVPCLRQGGSTAAAIERFGLDNSSDPDGDVNGSWIAKPYPDQLPSDIGAGGVRIPPYVVAGAQGVGATFGLAYSKTRDVLYAGSFLRARAPFGPYGTGAIYAVSKPRAAAPTTSLLVDLNAVFGPATAGLDPHPPSSTDFTNDAASMPLVGKVSLGDVEISPDEQTLYTINLADRRLYAIPLSGPFDQLTIHRYGIPTTVQHCGNAADVRPFGLGFDDAGRLYVGGVCTAESTGLAGQVRAFVWRFEDGVFTMVLDEPLSYTRHATFGAWLGAPSSTLDERPQPVLATIAFDGADMILGIRDRFGDQMPGPGLDPEAYPFPRTRGDILRACPGGALGYTLETGAACGGRATAGVPGDGPGGGSFYFEDVPGDGTPTSAYDASQGSVLTIPGYGDVVTTSFDPVNRDSNGTRYFQNVYTGGVQRYANDSGRIVGAYDVILRAEDGWFGKTNGLGDLEALCAVAPVEIGDRIWRDTDGDGQQDVDEAPLANVRVELWLNGAPAGETATDAAGTYRFTGVQPASTYEVRVPAGQPPIEGLLPTPANTGSDATDSDGERRTGYIRAAVETGPPGTSSHGIDFGFALPLVAGVQVGVGDRVFADRNGNGLFDTGERGIAGAEVVLRTADGKTTLGSTRTDAAGCYVFAGLEPGSYLISATGRAGQRSTFDRGTTGSGSVDSDDSGRGRGARADSAIVVLVPGEAPTGESSCTSGGMRDVDMNSTVDFGFVGTARFRLKGGANAPSFERGKTIRITIAAQALGTAALRASLCARLPRGLTYVNATGGRFRAGRVCWRKGVLQTRRAYKVRLVATTTATTAPGLYKVPISVVAVNGKMKNAVVRVVVR